MNEEQFIKEYNSNIARLKKADEYLMNEKVSIEIRSSNKILTEYNKIIKTLSTLQQQYKDTFEKEMDLEEKFNGFILTS